MDIDMDVHNQRVTASLRPHLLARFVCILSASTIIAALLMRHFIPNRFRIHPYPYLSDAGLRDPERFVQTFGLSLSAALFIPVAAALYLLQTYKIHSYHTRCPNRYAHLSLRLRLKSRPIPCHKLPAVALTAACGLAFSLALFSTVPGWFFFHHIGAGSFAACSLVWCLCHTMLSHALLQVQPTWRGHMPFRVRFMYILTTIQALIIFLFAVVWASVKAAFPFKMIPNKDPRFIMLALMEYLGTASIITFIAIISRELQNDSLEITLRPARRSMTKNDVANAGLA